MSETINVMGKQSLITDCGYKGIESIKKGDLIYTANGDYTKVQDVAVSDFSGLCKFVKVNGFFDPFVVQDTDKVLAYQGNKGERTIDSAGWVDIASLKVGDMCIHISEDGSGESLLTGYFSNDYAAKFLGYYTLEGFLNRDKGKVIIHIDNRFPSMEEDIMLCCSSAFGADMESYEYMGNRYLSVVNKEIYDLCSMFGDKASARLIPETVVNAEKKFLLSFIEPLLYLNKNSEGSYFRPSSSLEMFKGYQRILLKMGGFSNIYHCISKNGKFYYYALIMNSNEFNMVKAGNMPEDLWYKSGNVSYLKVVDIQEDMYRGKVFGLTLEDGSSYCNHLVYFK